MQDHPVDEPLFEFEEDESASSVELSEIPAAFDEQAYLAAFTDIARSIRLGECRSAFEHYLKHGAQEQRLRDPRYVEALRSGAAEPTPAPESSPAPPLGLDVVFACTSGLYLVIGWIDDRHMPLREIVLLLNGRTQATTQHVARCRREDAEGAIGQAPGYLLGFWAVLQLPAGTSIPSSCEIELYVGRTSAVVSVQPHALSDAQLRETLFEYLAKAAYLGNPQVEAFVQLERGPGEALLAFNAAMSARITDSAYVERFGPRPSKLDGSIIVCLFGKPEFLFLQSALFSASLGCGNYEFVYVSNSPELTEALQREAQIAAQIYGLSLTLVFLPGNAGFGAANNVAVRHARSKRILIVNPDVFPRDNAWAQAHTRLVESLPADQTAMFGVPLYYDDGSLMHGGMYFEADTGLSVRPEGITPQVLLRVEHYGKGAPPGTTAYLRSRPVPAVTGAFISADREWFEKLGGFSEQYVFGHYEDADLCLKSLDQGRAVWMHNIPFWHLEGKGSERRLAHEGGSLINRWHFTRSWGERIAYDLSGREPPIFAGASLSP